MFTSVRIFGRKNIISNVFLYVKKQLCVFFKQCFCNKKINNLRPYLGNIFLANLQNILNLKLETFKIKL